MFDYNAFQHIDTFQNCPIDVFTPNTPISSDRALFLTTSRAYFEPSSSHRKPKDPRTLQTQSLHNATIDELYTALARHPSCDQLQHLVLGPWWTSSHHDAPATEHIRLLTHHAHAFQHLRSLFLAEIIQPECMLSILPHGDISPLFTALPHLEHLTVRGSQNLSFGTATHAPNLTSFTIQTGNLTRPTLQSLWSAFLPSLTHLELWTGRERYGANIRPQDLAPLLGGKLFPALTHLGLRNCDRARECLQALSASPLMHQLQHLDLSHGNLTNHDIDLILYTLAHTPLLSLDLRNNYLSDTNVARIKASWNGTLLCGYGRSIHDALPIMTSLPNIDWDTFPFEEYEYMDVDDDEALLNAIEEHDHIDLREAYYCAIGE